MLLEVSLVCSLFDMVYLLQHAYSLLTFIPIFHLPQGFWHFDILFLVHHFSAYMCCPFSSYSLLGSFLWLLNPVSQDLINNPIYHLLFQCLDQVPRIQSQACFPSSFRHMLAGSCIFFLSLLVPIHPQLSFALNPIRIILYLPTLQILRGAHIVQQERGIYIFLKQESYDNSEQGRLGSL